MATIWTRRRGGCVLSATFEDRTTPCDFETKQKHTFLSEEEVSLFHSLFFVGEEKSRKIESAKKPPYSSQSAKAHSQSRRSLKKKDRRPRGMMLSNDDDGVHFALTRFFFRCSRADHFDPRRFVRANIENDDDDDDADVSLATRFSLRSFYPNDDFGDERRRRRGRGLPRKNASAETTTTKKKPTAPYFWSAQSLSVARETRTIRKRPT